MSPQRPIEPTMDAIVIGLTAAADAAPTTAGDVITLTILLRINGELMATVLPITRKKFTLNKSL